MGKADEYQFDYLEDNYRFADQVNGALFQGRQIVKPDELEPAEAQSVYLGKKQACGRISRQLWIRHACGREE